MWKLTSLRATTPPKRSVTCVDLEQPLALGDDGHPDVLRGDVDVGVDLETSSRVGELLVGVAVGSSATGRWS